MKVGVNDPLKGPLNQLWSLQYLFWFSKPYGKSTE